MCDVMNHDLTEDNHVLMDHGREKCHVLGTHTDIVKIAFIIARKEII